MTRSHGVTRTVEIKMMSSTSVKFEVWVANILYCNQAKCWSFGYLAKLEASITTIPNSLEVLVVSSPAPYSPAHIPGWLHSSYSRPFGNFHRGTGFGQCYLALRLQKGSRHPAPVQPCESVYVVFLCECVRLPPPSSETPRQRGEEGAATPKLTHLLILINHACRVNYSWKRHYFT